MQPWSRALPSWRDVLAGALGTGHALRARAADLARRHRAASPAVRLPIQAAAVLAAFSLLAAYRFAIATGDYRNSNDAGTFLAGAEMADGNWRLHGWVMPFDGGYPTDVAAMALLKLLSGWHPILMQGLEAAIWAAIALVGTGLACAGRRSRFLPGTIAIALSLLAFNVFEHGWRDVTLTNIGSHGSTILLTLSAFALVATGAERSGRSIRHLALFGLIMVAGDLADPVFEVIAGLPILAVSLLGMRGQAWRPGLVRIAVVVAAAGLAQALLAANAHNGGFRRVALAVSLATFPQALDHAAFAAQSIARLLGAEFFGRSLGGPLVAGPAIALLRAPFVLLFAVAWAEVGARLLRRSADWPAGRPAPPAEDLEQLLWLSLSLCIASACMTTAIVNEAGVRFFLPAAVAGSILVARRFGSQALPAGFGAVVLLASVAIGILRASPDPPRQVTALPEIHRIIDVLEKRGLRHGYAGYWEGTIVTVLSDREITSLPLYEAGDGQLHPLGYLSNLDWFRGPARDWHGRVFFISDRIGPADVFTAPEDAVQREFGHPVERIVVGRFVIGVYDLPPHALMRLQPQGGRDSVGPMSR